MEKSFLHFKVGSFTTCPRDYKANSSVQATNPDWTPNDQSGSLFLSRMADLKASQGTPRSGRHATERNLDGSLHERAQEYDRALLQSQHAAARRRMATSGVLGMSALNTQGVSASSVFDGYTAQTAVLGDSQGSTMPTIPSPRPTPQADLAETAMISDEELAANGGLGESYVDGGKRSRPYEPQEEEELDDGGVIGLLAQIYARKDGPSRVM